MPCRPRKHWEEAYSTASATAEYDGRSDGHPKMGRLRNGGLYRLRILPRSRGSVHFGTGVEGRLCRRDIRSVSMPYPQGSLPQGSSKREAKLPKVRSHPVHGIEMCCGLFGSCPPERKTMVGMSEGTQRQRHRTVR